MNKDSLTKRFLGCLFNFIHTEVHSRVEAIENILRFKNGIAVENIIEQKYLTTWLNWDEEKRKAVREAIDTKKVVKEHLVEFIRGKLLAGDIRQDIMLGEIISDFISAVEKHQNHKIAAVQLLDQYSDSYIRFVKRDEDDILVSNKKGIQAYRSVREYLDSHSHIDIKQTLFKIIDNFNGEYECRVDKWIKDFTFDFGSKNLTIKDFKGWLRTKCSDNEVEKIVEGITFDFVPFTDSENNTTGKVIVRSRENKG